MSTKKTSKNHFSPILANQQWTDERSGWHYTHYYRCAHRRKVVKGNKGKKAWGFEYKLYSQTIENSFDKDLENDAAVLYEKLLNNEVLNYSERLKWGQFIIAQSVRVPSFFRYRDSAARNTDDDYSYKEHIVGHIDHPVNKLIADRNWIVLEAHERDFFVRTDNPVYVTGFFENPTTVIFYPLSPTKCFVACSMPEFKISIKGQLPAIPKQKLLQLEGGDAYHLNFEFIKSAYDSIIVSTKNDCDVLQAMSLDVLGVYPQIPFLMQSASNEMEQYEKQTLLTDLMSITDGVEYSYREYPFTPFYGIEFTHGINPFSIFGVTDDRLPSS